MITMVTEPKIKLVTIYQNSLLVDIRQEPIINVLIRKLNMLLLEYIAQM